MDAPTHRSIDYRTKALPRSVLRRVLRTKQVKIYAHFARSFPPRRDWRVLDVGTHGALTDPRD